MILKTPRRSNKSRVFAYSDVVARGSRVMTYRKKLIEVALPLDAINAESARPRWYEVPP